MRVVGSPRADEKSSSHDQDALLPASISASPCVKDPARRKRRST